MCVEYNCWKLSPAFRKIIRLEKPCMNVFPGVSRVQDPRGIINAQAQTSGFQQFVDLSLVLHDSLPLSACLHAPPTSFDKLAQEHLQLVL